MTRLPIRSIAVPLIALHFLTVGCGRQQPVTATPAPPVEAPATEGAAAPESTATTDAAAPPAPPAAAQPAAAATPATETQPQLEGAIHPFMTAQLRRYIDENGRMPASFAEFASARMDSVPFAPDGMEYVIDTARREVKVVRKSKR